MLETVAAIIEKENKVLLMKRSNTHAFSGFWALPGGKIDNGETPKQAIIREVKEETNLEFVPERFFGDYAEAFPEYNWFAETKVFSGPFSGIVKGNEESTDIKWFSIEEANNMKLAFNHNKIIHDFYKNENR